MKNLIYFGLVVLLLTSCSEYQRVLKNEDVSKKYNLGVELYEEAKNSEKKSNAKYRKAVQLFEQILPQYRGKPQGEKLAFIYSDAYYQLGDYFLSGYQFERFAKAYPSSERLEEAYFKSARSYYELSPVYSLDQSETEKALGKLQEYFALYPEGSYTERANVMVKDLRFKLDKKAYEIAKQYHHTSQYKPAIAAFDNYVIDYPGSSFKEKAMYYKLESAYLLAINSYDYLVEERLKNAQDYYNTYIENFPQGELSKEATEIGNDINNRLENTI